MATKLILTILRYDAMLRSHFVYKTFGPFASYDEAREYRNEKLDAMECSGFYITALEK